MINALTVTGFKCLNGQKIPLRNITLFTGVNGSGKSSIIQSLLLARVAALAVRDGRAIVPLNGPFGLTLGRVADVISFIPDIWSEIRLSLEAEGASETEGVSAELVLAARAGTDRYLRIEQSNPQLSILAGGQFGQFTYLAAEREGPRDFQPMQSAPVEMLEIGARGEYLADVLQAYEREPVFSWLEHPCARGLRLASRQKHG
jgi:AAA ATPase domain